MLMRRRVGRLIAPPVEVKGWCRLPDWGASDAVRVHSKHGAIRSPPGYPLAVPYAGASDRLLDSSHGAFYRRDMSTRAHVVELVEIAAVVILSVGLGLAGAGALLSMVFLCFTKPATGSNVAAVGLEAAYEASAPYAQPLRLRTSAAS